MAKKVLIIEDTPTLVDLYKTRFTIEGFTTFTASNGKDALATAEAEHPDLFMVDIMLPDMDGFQIIEALKKMPSNKDAKYIVLTALELEETKQKAAELGADEYLVKSRLTLEDIVAIAEKVLSR